MSQLHTLYRKYRPKKFKEIIGQDSIVESLSNSIEKDSIAHSYIFAGSRGTGKTSTARIFADALLTAPHDLYEIDAASNRGIDDIREIREAVHTLPYESKYKIYIIDEAHMLTKEAWNALLKTLEEPPEHVIFIFATTEVEKIPETIVSRSQCFSFKKPSLEILQKVVSATAKKEEYKINDDAARLIALLSDGSFRDAHGVLQKVIATTKGDTIDLATVEASTSAPKHTRVIAIIEALVTKDAPKLLSLIKEFEDDHTDPKLLSKLLLETLRKVLLVRIDKTIAGQIEKETEAHVWKAIVEFAEKGKDVISSNTLLALLKDFSLIERSPEPFIVIELALLNLMLVE